MTNAAETVIDQLKLDFGIFRDNVYRLLDSDMTRTWIEQTQESYEHGRVYELGVWWKDTNGQKFGYVFLARVGWKGPDQEEWEKIRQILFDHNWAIGPYEDVKVWDLSNILNQDKPLPRCERCGKVS